VHRIGPGPVLQSPTRGRFLTMQRLSKPRVPSVPLFSDHRAPPIDSDRTVVFRIDVCCPRTCLYHLRAQRRRLPIHVLLFVLPITSPLCTERCHVERPLRPSPDAAFVATTSARAHRRSTTSEPAPSTTPLAYHRWLPPRAHRCNEASLVSLLLHR
jgi:hypothetical protein